MPEEAIRRLEERFEQIIQSEGQTVLGWRTVPTSNSMLGETAKSCEPFIRQIFIGRNPQLEEDIAFSSMAQDKVGHALALYTILHEQKIMILLLCLPSLLE